MNRESPKHRFLTRAQLRSELARCEHCEEKPCREGCPADCSAADFVMAARVGLPSDLGRSAGQIMMKNPLGGVCGMVCPDRFCMAACSRKLFDRPIDIPAVQAAIVEQAKRLGVLPAFARPRPSGKRVAVVGGGPAGLAAATTLAQQGHAVDLFEARDRLGGMCNLIPAHRLDREVLRTDIDFVLSLGEIAVHTGQPVAHPKQLLAQGYQAVVVAVGLWQPIRLGIPGEELAMGMINCLADPERYTLHGRVAVVGGGATAVDCAVTAKMRGAAQVELFALETLAELPLSAKERAELLEHDIEVNGRVRLTAIVGSDGAVTGIETRKVMLPEGQPFRPQAVRDVAGSDLRCQDFSAVIIAIGMRAALKREELPGLFYAGDVAHGPTTVVEAVAAGKNTGLEVEAFLGGHAIGEADAAATQPAPSTAVTAAGPAAAGRRIVKSRHRLPGLASQPVSLETDFFGRRIPSPYLLSAAPPSDGYQPMKKAYEAGWAGGIMKTAFDNVPIHIPSEYMFTFNPTTWGNCDNVSGHPLDRVCREVERLVREYPDRLTMASTGGPVSGRDESDRAGWQSNTRKLEAAGAMGIEYSLSCPQGGDGTEGDIVSQNAALTAKIIDWILEASDPRVPKLFKLTAAVTSIVPILRAIQEAIACHPTKPAGITLANTFPTLAFRPGAKREWEEGVIVGMSGEGVTPISYLTLARAVPLGVAISGNGGPMDYKAAMDFLALGVRTVQFCTLVMKHGYGIIDELENGTSFLMAERGIASMAELIGRAQPQPVTDFMALSARKRISHHDHALCLSCGNCSRCSYLAIALDEQRLPHTDPARCIGCSICARKCFAGAISMRERTAEEAAALVEE